MITCMSCHVRGLKLRAWIAKLQGDTPEVIADRFNEAEPGKHYVMYRAMPDRLIASLWRTGDFPPYEPTLLIEISSP